MKTQVIMTKQTDKENRETLRIYSFDSEADDDKKPKVDYEAAIDKKGKTVVSAVSSEKQASLEMQTLKLLLGSTKKSCKTALRR